MSGERPGYREAIDQMTKRLRESGVKPDKAREIARESARRHDAEQSERRR